MVCLVSPESLVSCKSVLNIAGFCTIIISCGLDLYCFLFSGPSDCYKLTSWNLAGLTVFTIIALLVLSMYCLFYLFPHFFLMFCPLVYMDILLLLFFLLEVFLRSLIFSLACSLSSKQFYISQLIYTLGLLIWKPGTVIAAFLIVLC